MPGKIKASSSITQWSISPEDLTPGSVWQQLDGNGLLIETYQYNGYIWLGKPQKTYFNFSQISDASSIILSVDKKTDLFLNNLVLDYLVEGKNNAGKYWQFHLVRANDSLGFTLLKSANTIEAEYKSLNLQIELQDRLGFNNTLFYLLQINKIGNPGGLTLSGSLEYQPIQYS